MVARLDRDAQRVGLQTLYLGGFYSSVSFITHDASGPGCTSFGPLPWRVLQPSRRPRPRVWTALNKHGTRDEKDDHFQRRPRVWTAPNEVGDSDGRRLGSQIKPGGYDLGWLVADFEEVSGAHSAQTHELNRTKGRYSA